MKRSFIDGLGIRWIGVVSLALAACTPPDGPPASGCPAVDTGDATGTMAHVRYLADDALEGRRTGSEGERCAAEYIADRFQALGLTPAGDGGGWYQRFPVRTGSELTAPASFEMSGDGVGNGNPATFSDLDWRPYGFSGTGQVSAPLVYAGVGTRVPGGDAADVASEATVEGQIMVVEATTPEVPAGSLYADPHFKGNVAQGRGAAALVILLDDGEPLPELGSEDRPFLRIPVVAARGDAATMIRAAAGGEGEASLSVSVGPRESTARNVVATIPGSDPSRADEVVIVGAHYDHLGLGGEGSLAPGIREIHNGADDNASGTAALLEVAAELADAEPARTVVFLAFSGEERGLLGSAHFVTEPTVALEEAVAMINLDMVGRIRDNRVTVFGLGTAPEWEGLLTGANQARDRPFDLATLPDGYGPSDHSSFYGAGIPVLHFFSNTHAEYHRPEDDWETINGPALERLSTLVADLTLNVAGREGTAEPVRLSLVETAPPEPSGEGRSRGYGPYFGSVPDMGYQDFGVRLTGVREGSPAANAGLESGDVIVGFGGQEVGDLYAYTYALREMAPGDVVDVVIIRDGQRYNRQAVLGERR